MYIYIELGLLSVCIKLITPACFLFCIFISVLVHLRLLCITGRISLAVCRAATLHSNGWICLGQADPPPPSPARDRCRICIQAEKIGLLPLTATRSHPTEVQENLCGSASFHNNCDRLWSEIQSDVSCKMEPQLLCCPHGDTSGPSRFLLNELLRVLTFIYIVCLC